MTESLNLIGWLACVVYSTIPLFWLAIHPRAKYWRLRRRSPYRVLLPLWIAMWIVAGLVTATWRHVVFYSSLWAWVPAALLFGAGFWLYSKSGKHFSVQQLGGIPEVMPGAGEQRLITAGIHSRLRHPVYSCAFSRNARLESWHWSRRLLCVYSIRAAEWSHHDQA